MGTTAPTTLVLSGRTTDHFCGRLTWHPFALGILAAGVAYALSQSPRITAASGLATSAVSLAIAMRYFNQISITGRLQGCRLPSQAETAEEYDQRVGDLGRVKVTLTHEMADISLRQSAEREEFAGHQLPSQFVRDFPRGTYIVGGETVGSEADFVSAVKTLAPKDSKLLEDTAQVLHQSMAVGMTAVVQGAFSGVGDQYSSQTLEAGGEALTHFAVDVDDAGRVTYSYRARWLLFSSPGVFGGRTVDAETRIVRGEPQCRVTLFPPVQRAVPELFKQALQTS